MENKLLEAMKFRHAAKAFTDKKISEEIMNEILEAGRLSPSSFGIEHWKFLVITNQEIKEKLTPIAFNQEQVKQSSHLVIILAKNKDVKTQSLYVEELMKNRMPQEVFDFMFSFFNSFTKDFTEEKSLDWSKKQTYIAAANMMTMGAYLGVDSCPMEGFDEKATLEALNINSEEFGVALYLPFGYRAKDPREKTRLTKEEVIQRIE